MKFAGYSSEVIKTKLFDIEKQNSIFVPVYGAYHAGGLAFFKTEIPRKNFKAWTVIQIATGEALFLNTKTASIARKVIEELIETGYDWEDPLIYEKNRDELREIIKNLKEKYRIHV